MFVLVSYESGFLFVSKDNITTCRIDQWPISDPVAQMQCDRGGDTTMELTGERSLLFDGIAMNRYEGPIPCGAGGAEWPD